MDLSVFRAVSPRGLVHSCTKFASALGMAEVLTPLAVVSFPRENANVIWVRVVTGEAARHMLNVIIAQFVSLRISNVISEKVIMAGIVQ